MKRVMFILLPLEYTLNATYVPSFKVIGLLVLVKKILKGFYHLWAWRLEEKISDNMDDGPRMPGYTISSSMSLKAQLS